MTYKHFISAIAFHYHMTEQQVSMFFYAPDWQHDLDQSDLDHAIDWLGDELERIQSELENMRKRDH